MLDTDTESDTELTTTTANAFKVYQAEIGVITSHIADKLKSYIEDYSEPWLIEAMKVASVKQARNLPYVEAILKRWKTDGKDAGKKPPREYHGKPDQSSSDGNEKILEEIRNGKF